MIKQSSDSHPVPDNADITVGIVVALPEELSTLTAARLQRGETCRLGSSYISYCGAGMANAETAAKQLVEKGVQVLISWGCAAGLSPEAKPGDLLLATQVIDSQRCFDADPAIRMQLQQVLAGNMTLHTGTLYTSATLVELSLDKQHLYADTAATALDMESVAIANVAHEAQLPIAVIRSIADPVTMDLPQAVAQALNADGEVSLPKLLAHLCRHPGEIPALIKLGTHFKAAQKTLKTVARELQQPHNRLAWLAERHHD